jgi:hypothetical protein
MFLIGNLNLSVDVSPLDANSTDPNVDEELGLLPPPAPLVLYLAVEAGPRILIGF